MKSFARARNASARTDGVKTVVAFALIAAACRSALATDGSTVNVTGGALNGVGLVAMPGGVADPRYPEVFTTTGVALTGTINLQVKVNYAAASIVQLAATPTWGNPQTSYWGIDPSVPHGQLTNDIHNYTTGVNVTTPGTVGTYYLAVAMSGVYNYDQLMSGTHPAYPAVWGTGFEVARQPASMFESAIQNGLVNPFNMYVPPTPGTPAPEERAMGAVRVQVTGQVVYGHSEAGNQPPFDLEIADAFSQPHAIQQVPLPSLAGQVIQTPQWSRDGQWITFNGGPGGSAQVYVVHPDGNGLNMMTGGVGDLVQPAFSPDGSKVAYHQVGQNIRILPVTPSGGTLLGVPPETPIAPNPSGTARWSPDGTKISYTDWVGPPHSDVWVYDIAGSTATRITSASANEAYNTADWSPDGKYLVMSHLDATGDYHIYETLADGTGTPWDLTPWLPAGYLATWPTFSPDGESIVFNSNMPGSYGGSLDIWVMDKNGTSGSVWDLTNEPGDEVNPSVVAPVPEPQALGFMALGVGLLVGRRRRRGVTR